MSRLAPVVGTALGGALLAAPETPADRVVLAGVDRYRVVEPMNECVRVVLAYRGERYSPAYVQGISGSAFRIGGICPCAPTCLGGMSHLELAALLGYEAEVIPIGPNGEHLAELIAQVRGEIDAGRPAIVWHAFTAAEYDVVCGYDAGAKRFLGRGSYAGTGDAYAEADEARTATAAEVSGLLDALAIGEKSGALDAPRAERDALRQAVAHAHSTRGLDRLGSEKWTFLEGIACYDRWVRHWREPTKAPELGDRYCLGIFSSTHRSAGDFLTEIAPGHPAGAEALHKAADHFRAEADLLDRLKPLIGWGTPDGPDPEHNRPVADTLASARYHYVVAIEALETALRRLEA